jgi:hypothetical protein
MDLKKELYELFERYVERKLDVRDHFKFVSDHFYNYADMIILAFMLKISLTYTFFQVIL